MHLIGVGVVVLIVAALYRRIESIRMLTTALWVVMLSRCALIAACFSHFSAHLAFTYPAGAFHLDGAFFTGLGAGLLIAVYDYLGYNTTAYMGDELKNPGRTMPRVDHLLDHRRSWSSTWRSTSASSASCPWQQVARSTSVASLAVTHSWGHTAADIVTVLIVVTAFASVFAGLLGGSRVPFNAARDRVFFGVFGRLHPRHGFPHVALLVMGVITAAGSLLDLTTVINMLTTVAVLVQSIAQIVALTVLRRRQPSCAGPTGSGSTRCRA